MFSAELLKVVKNKGFWLIFLIFSAAVILFATFAPIDELIDNKLYKELYAAAKDLTPEQAEEYVSEHFFEYSIYHTLSWGFESPELFEDERASEYIKKYEGLEENSVEIFHKYMLYKQELENITSINEYKKLASSFGKQAKALSGFSLFADENSFEYRSIIRSAEAYKNSADVEPVYSVSKGASTAVSNVVCDISIMAIAVVSAILLFSDRKSSQFALSMKNGGRRYASIKLCVLALVITLTAIIISSLNIGAAAIIYGLGDINRPIQGLDGFVLSPFAVSVGETLLISTTFKAAAGVGFGFIAAALCVFLKSSASVFVLSVGIAAVQTALFMLVPSQSNLALLKYANLWTLSDIKRIIGEYLNLNIFGYPFSNSFVCISFVVLIIIAAVALIVYLYPLIIRNSNVSFIITNRIFTTSLLSHELYRVFVERKGIAAVILAICASMVYGSTFKMNYDVDERYKRAYISDIGGEINAGTYKYLEAERQRFADVQKRIDDLQKKYEDDEISPQGYSAAYAALLQETAGSRSFLYIEQQTISADGRGELIYDTGYAKLTASNGFANDVVPSIMAVLLTIILIAPMYSRDKEIGLQKLISSTIYGEKGLYIRRMLITTVISFLVALIAYIPQYCTVFAEYGGEWLSSPVQSLMQLSDFPFRVSILDYLILINAIRIVSYVLLGEIALMISGLSNKSFVSLTISLMVFVMPLILYMLGADFSCRIGLTPFLIGNALWI